jgi:excisionase family DNA binding protein
MSATEIENSRSDLPILLYAKDVAYVLGISVKTVHKLVRDGKLGCVQVTSKERRFTEEQVRAYIDAQSKTIHEGRVDRKPALRVSSEPKKGGERKEDRKEKAKDSWASLKKEMSRWT